MCEGDKELYEIVIIEMFVLFWVHLTHETTQDDDANYLLLLTREPSYLIMHDDASCHTDAKIMQMCQLMCEESVGCPRHAAFHVTFALMNREHYCAKNFLFAPCFFSIKFTAFSDTSSESQKVN